MFKKIDNVYEKEQVNRQKCPNKFGQGDIRRGLQKDSKCPPVNCNHT